MLLNLPNQEGKLPFIIQFIRKKVSVIAKYRLQTQEWAYRRRTKPNCSNFLAFFKQLKPLTPEELDLG